MAGSNIPTNLESRTNCGKSLAKNAKTSRFSLSLIAGVCVAKTISGRNGGEAAEDRSGFGGSNPLNHARNWRVFI